MQLVTFESLGAVLSDSPWAHFTLLGEVIRIMSGHFQPFQQTVTFSYGLKHAHCFRLHVVLLIFL